MWDWYKPIHNFAGVRAEKLRLGLMASKQAGPAQYYGEPGVIEEFKNFLHKYNYGLSGFMIWDSHWDSLNGFAISKTCTGP